MFSPKISKRIKNLIHTRVNVKQQGEGKNTNIPFVKHFKNE